MLSNDALERSVRALSEPVAGARTNCPPAARSKRKLDSPR